MKFLNEDNTARNLEKSRDFYRKRADILTDYAEDQVGGFDQKLPNGRTIHQEIIKLKELVAELEDRITLRDQKRSKGIVKKNLFKQKMEEAAPVDDYGNELEFDILNYEDEYQEPEPSKIYTVEDVQEMARQLGMFLASRELEEDVYIYTNGKRYSISDSGDLVELETCSPKKYIEYAREPNILTMSFEGDLYYVLEHNIDYLDKFFDNYNLYYELGDAWNLTVAPKNDREYEEYDAEVTGGITEAKKKKKKAQGWFVNYNAGNVDYNNDFFNHVNGTCDGDCSVDAGVGSDGGFGESLNEELTEEDQRRLQELEQRRLEIEDEIDYNDNNPNYDITSAHAELDSIDKAIQAIKNKQ
jgi:hypothetical protein